MKIHCEYRLNSNIFQDPDANRELTYELEEIIRITIVRIQQLRNTERTFNIPG